MVLGEGVNGQEPTFCEACGAELGKELKSAPALSTTKIEEKQPKPNKNSPNNAAPPAELSLDEKLDLLWKIVVMRRSYELLKSPFYKSDLPPHVTELSLGKEIAYARLLRNRLKREKMPETWFRAYPYLKEPFLASLEATKPRLKNRKLYKEEYQPLFRDAVQKVFALVRGTIQPLECRGLMLEVVDALKEHAFGKFDADLPPKSFGYYFSIFAGRTLYGGMRFLDGKLKVKGGNRELEEESLETLAKPLSEAVAREPFNREWLLQLAPRTRRSFNKEYRSMQKDLLYDWLYRLSLLDYLKDLARLLFELSQREHELESLRPLARAIASDLVVADQFENDKTFPRAFKDGLKVVLARYACYSLTQGFGANDTKDLRGAVLTEEREGKLVSSIIASFVSQIPILKGYRSNLCGISRQDFEKHFILFCEKVKRDKIYGLSFHIALQRLVETVFALMTGQRAPEEFTLEERIFAYDLTHYSFDPRADADADSQPSDASKPEPIKEEVKEELDVGSFFEEEIPSETPKSNEKKEKTMEEKREEKPSNSDMSEKLSRAPNIDYEDVEALMPNGIHIDARAANDTATEFNIIDVAFANFLKWKIEPSDERIEVSHHAFEHAGKTMGKIRFRGVELELEFYSIEGAVEWLTVPFLLSKHALELYSDAKGLGGKITLDLNSPKSITDEKADADPNATKVGFPMIKGDRLDNGEGTRTQKFLSKLVAAMTALEKEKLTREGKEAEIRAMLNHGYLNNPMRQDIASKYLGLRDKYISYALNQANDPDYTIPRTELNTMKDNLKKRYGEEAFANSLKELFDGYEGEGPLKETQKQKWHLHNPNLKVDYFRELRKDDFVQGYWLGFISGDGYVNRRSGTGDAYMIKLELKDTEADRDLLRQFCETLGIDPKRIQPTSHLQESGTVTDGVVVHFQCQEMHDDLIKLELPHSKLTEAEKVRTHQLPPFVRNGDPESNLLLGYLYGFYDAEGKQGQTSITCGSKRLLEEFKEKYNIRTDVTQYSNNIKVKDKYKEKTWYLSVGATMMNQLIDKGKQYGVGLKSKIKRFSEHIDASDKFLQTLKNDNVDKVKMQDLLFCFNREELAVIFSATKFQIDKISRDWKLKLPPEGYWSGGRVRANIRAKIELKRQNKYPGFVNRLK